MQAILTALQQFGLSSSQPSSPTTTTIPKENEQPTKINTKQNAATSLKLATSKLPASVLPSINTVNVNNASQQPSVGASTSPRFNLPKQPTNVLNGPAHYKNEVCTPVLANAPSSTPLSSSARATFKDKYDVCEMLGLGGFGHIYTCTRKTDGKKLAAKFLKRSKIPANRWTVDPEFGLIPMEAYVLKQVNHPGIVKFYELFMEGNYVIIVQELFGAVWNESNVSSQDKSDAPPQAGHVNKHRSMDLFELLETKRLTEDQVRYIFKQLVQVVSYLYNEHGLVHGDLKDENILVDANLTIKLIDFGGAVKVRSVGTSTTGSDLLLSATRHFHGTLEFAPPEILRGDRYDAHKSDVWSLGVLLYSIMYGKLPFPDLESVLRMEFKRRPEHPLMMDLISHCLVKDAKDRFVFDEILAHPWMTC